MGGEGAFRGRRGWLVWLALAMGVVLGLAQVPSLAYARLSGDWSAFWVDPGQGADGEVFGLPTTFMRLVSSRLDPARLRSFIDPARDERQQPDRVMDLLDVRPGMVVADVGAGSGYFSWKLAPRVLPGGRVWGTDISWDAVHFMSERWQLSPQPGLSFVLHEELDLLFPPGSLDRVMVVDVHFFFYPHAREVRLDQGQVDVFWSSVRRALKSDGRLMVIEKRAEIPDQDPHKGGLDKDEIVRQLGRVGFRLTTEADWLETQYLLLFERG